ncbi:MAG: nucleotidyltransferase domain-containing protein [Ktedonobacterales bacterium]
MGQTNKTAQEAVRNYLARIESDQHIAVLYACESGSRAWDFASDDSDYDVRGIYVRPVADYLRLRTPDDTYEKFEKEFSADILDVSLWDVFKAMRLLNKLNPQIIEWLFAEDEQQYVNDVDGMLYNLRAHIRQHHLHSNAFRQHYVGMARQNYHQYIVSPTHLGEPVRLKKYLYALRPLLVLYYIQRYDQYPPLSFEETLLMMPEQTLPGTVRYHIRDILDQKRAGGELGAGAAIPALDNWIQASIIELRDAFPKEDSGGVARLELELLCERTLSTLLAHVRAPR